MTGLNKHHKRTPEGDEFHDETLAKFDLNENQTTIRRTDVCRVIDEQVTPEVIASLEDEECEAT